MQGFGDSLDMFFVVGFTGNFEDNFFKAVGHLGLVMVELDNIGVFLSEDTGNGEELAWFVRQENAETEYPASGYLGFFD